MMSGYRSTLVLFVIAVVGIQLSAQSPKSFYIGHSLTDGIPEMVQSLSEDHAAVDFSWMFQTIPGAPLRWHWDRKAAMDFTEYPHGIRSFYNETYGLPAGDFDVLVLTEGVPRYLPYINETYAYADSFYRFATAYNPDIQVYLYEDWHCTASGTPTGCSYDIDSNPWRQRLTDDLPMWESVVDTLNNRFNPTKPVCMIPAGQGLAALYDSIQLGLIPDIVNITDLFTDDIHLNDGGRYFIACIHFAMIHKTSPVGLTHQLQNAWGGNFVAPSPAQALKFQQIAWETVNNYPNSCLASSSSSIDVRLDNDGIVFLPNPTADIFEIQGLLDDYTIEILDAAGNVYQSLSAAGDRIEVNIQALPLGLYFIKIRNANNAQIHVELILKEN